MIGEIGGIMSEHEKKLRLIQVFQELENIWAKTDLDPDLTLLCAATEKWLIKKYSLSTKTIRESIMDRKNWSEKC